MSSAFGLHWRALLWLDMQAMQSPENEGLSPGATLVAKRSWTILPRPGGPTGVRPLARRFRQPRQPPLTMAVIAPSSMASPSGMESLGSASSLPSLKDDEARTISNEGRDDEPSEREEEDCTTTPHESPPVAVARRPVHDDEYIYTTTPTKTKAPPLFMRSEPRLRRKPSNRSLHGESPRELVSPRRRKAWLLPGDHPFKVMWDILTVLLSLFNAYLTHAAIRDRQFNSLMVKFCEVWFVLDIILNFFTQHSSEGRVLNSYRAVWARYLTTWFVVDVLSLFPGEAIYVQPIIDAQNRRGFFRKSFFRTKAVVRVTRVLRGRHFRLFGRVTRQTRKAGVGARRVLALIIKYVPKYLLFWRHMKAVIMVRVLRQVHWVRKVWRGLFTKQPNKDDEDDDTYIEFSESEDDEWRWQREWADPLSRRRLQFDNDDDDDDVGPY